MIYKVVVGFVAAALLLIYVAPVAIRLNEVALWVISLIGLGMMLVDLWQSLKSKED